MISEACDIFAKCSHRFGVNTSTWLYSIEDMCRKCMHVKYTTAKYSSNTSGYKFSHFLSCNYLSKLKSVMYYCYRLNLSFTSNACSVQAFTLNRKLSDGEISTNQLLATNLSDCFSIVSYKELQNKPFLHNTRNMC